jgi:hypothetical protein
VSCSTSGHHKGRYDNAQEIPLALCQAVHALLDVLSRLGGGEDAHERHPRLLRVQLHVQRGDDGLEGLRRAEDDALGVVRVRVFRDRGHGGQSVNPKWLVRCVCGTGRLDAGVTLELGDGEP